LCEKSQIAGIARTGKPERPIGAGGGELMQRVWQAAIEIQLVLSEASLFVIFLALLVDAIRL
jgi:hypothetical protein